MRGFDTVECPKFVRETRVWTGRRPKVGKPKISEVDSVEFPHFRRRIIRSTILSPHVITLGVVRHQLRSKTASKVKTFSLFNDLLMIFQVWQHFHGLFISSGSHCLGQEVSRFITYDRNCKLVCAAVLKKSVNQLPCP